MKIPLMKKDKAIELDRYDSRAKSKGDIIKDFGQLLYGSEITPSFLAEPYRVYESIIKANVSRDSRVLELGAGTGEHTKILLDTSNDVVASDISINSLRLMEKKFACYPNLKTCEADIESLPFDNCSFDVVCSAGCLSYGDPDLVNREIFRILRGGGC
jgi:SAM-dependent methyltransferase